MIATLGKFTASKEIVPDKNGEDSSPHPTPQNCRILGKWDKGFSTVETADDLQGAYR